MQHFFCDFRRNGVYLTDTEGAWLESAEDAYLDAYIGAQEIIGDLLAEGEDPKHCAFEIRSTNEILFVLNFAEMLKLDKISHSPFIAAAHAHVERTKKIISDLGEELRNARLALAEAKELIAAEV